MSDEPGKDPREKHGKGRLVLVVSAKTSDEEDSSKDDDPSYGRDDALFARKALYRQAGLIEVRIDESRKRKAISEALSSWGVRPAGGKSKRRLLVIPAAVLVFAISLIPLYMASQNSLPGDPLWKLKRAGEGIRQWLARGAVSEARTALETTAERLDEASELAGDGRFDAARSALSRFYSEFDGARRRLRAVSKEAHPELYREADRQLEEAAALDQQLNGEAAHTTAPREPEEVGTLSPTPRPPWEPENPRETPG